jgi:hypothetical protein
MPMANRGSNGPMITASDILPACATAWTSAGRIVTDRAPIYPRIVDEMAPGARHITEQIRDGECQRCTAQQCFCGGVPRGNCRRPAVRSRDQGGAPGWTNDLMGR